MQVERVEVGAASETGSRRAARWAAAGRFYDGAVRQRAVGHPGRLSQLGIAVGAFVCAVSFSLFIYSISQLSSPLVSAAFIAGGVVLRQRGATPTAQAIATGMLVGGIVAAIASIALAAAGR
jgi:hypothetical protein